MTEYGGLCVGGPLDKRRLVSQYRQVAVPEVPKLKVTDPLAMHDALVKTEVHYYYWIRIPFREPGGPETEFCYWYDSKLTPVKALEKVFKEYAH